MPRDVTLTFDDGTTHLYKGVPDNVTPADVETRAAKDFSGKKLTNIDGGKQPATQPRSLASRIGGFVAGVPEAAAHVGSEIAAFPVEGVASAYQLATAPAGQRISSANQAIQSVGQAMTYQPRTPEGQSLARGADTVLSLPARGADYVGQRVTQATGSAGLGAATSLTLQAIPAVLGGEGLSMLRQGGAAARAATEAADAATRAKTFAESRAGLDWESLPDQFKQKLTAIATESKGLNKLDPKAVARVARAQSLKLPITRGQATRNLGQITSEESLQRSEAGQPLRDIQTQQDIGLHGQLDTLRAQTGAQAETRLQLGESVQGAERGKLTTLKAAKRLAYAKAKGAGELAKPVDITPLNDWLKVPANSRNAGYIKDAINDYRKGKSKSVSINDLEEIRKEASAEAGSTDKVRAYYAKGAVKQIDDILDNAGGNVYKQARAAHAAEQTEFARQDIVRKLTSARAKSTDRSVALEDTFDTTVRRGSNEQLQQLKRSLTEGGTQETRARGSQAWKDLQGATIDYLKDAASGRRAIRGEDEQLPFNSSFIDAVDELDKDGKLDVIFGPEARGVIRQLRDATRDLRTKPADRIAGSATTPRIVALLEKLTDLPGISHLGGMIKAVKGLGEGGKQAREVRAATTTPLDQASSAAAKAAKLRQIQNRVAPAVPFTLQDLNQ